MDDEDSSYLDSHEKKAARRRRKSTDDEEEEKSSDIDGNAGEADDGSHGEDMEEEIDDRQDVKDEKSGDFEPSSSDDDEEEEEEGKWPKLVSTRLSGKVKESEGHAKQDKDSLEGSATLNPGFKLMSKRAVAYNTLGGFKHWDTDIPETSLADSLVPEQEDIDVKMKMRCWKELRIRKGTPTPVHLYRQLTKSSGDQTSELSNWLEQRRNGRETPLRKEAVRFSGSESDESDWDLSELSEEDEEEDTALTRVRQTRLVKSVVDAVGERLSDVSLVGGRRSQLNSLFSSRAQLHEDTLKVKDDDEDYVEGYKLFDMDDVVRKEWHGLTEEGDDDLIDSDLSDLKDSDVEGSDYYKESSEEEGEREGMEADDEQEEEQFGSEDEEALLPVEARMGMGEEEYRKLEKAERESSGSSILISSDEEERENEDEGIPLDPLPALHDRPVTPSFADMNESMDMQLTSLAAALCPGGAEVVADTRCEEERAQAKRSAEEVMDFVNQWGIEEESEEDMEVDEPTAADNEMLMRGPCTPPLAEKNEDSLDMLLTPPAAPTVAPVTVSEPTVPSDTMKESNGPSDPVVNRVVPTDSALEPTVPTDSVKEPTVTVDTEVADVEEEKKKRDDKEDKAKKEDTSKNGRGDEDEIVLDDDNDEEDDGDIVEVPVEEPLPKKEPHKRSESSADVATSRTQVVTTLRSGESPIIIENEDDDIMVVDSEKKEQPSMKEAAASTAPSADDSDSDLEILGDTPVKTSTSRENMSVREQGKKVEEEMITLSDDDDDDNPILKEPPPKKLKLYDSSCSSTPKKSDDASSSKAQQQTLADILGRKVDDDVVATTTTPLFSASNDDLQSEKISLGQTSKEKKEEDEKEKKEDDVQMIDDDDAVVVEDEEYMGGEVVEVMEKEKEKEQEEGKKRSEEKEKEEPKRSIFDDFIEDYDESRMTKKESVHEARVPSAAEATTMTTSETNGPCLPPPSAVAHTGTSRLLSSPLPWERGSSASDNRDDSGVDVQIPDDIEQPSLTEKPQTSDEPMEVDEEEDALRDASSMMPFVDLDLMHLPVKKEEFDDDDEYPEGGEKQKTPELEPWSIKLQPVLGHRRALTRTSNGSPSTTVTIPVDKTRNQRFDDPRLIRRVSKDLSFLPASYAKSFDVDKRPLSSSSESEDDLESEINMDGATAEKGTSETLLDKVDKVVNTMFGSVVSEFSEKDARLKTADLRRTLVTTLNCAKVVQDDGDAEEWKAIPSALSCEQQNDVANTNSTSLTELEKTMIDDGVIPRWCEGFSHTTDYSLYKFGKSEGMWYPVLQPQDGVDTTEEQFSSYDVINALANQTYFATEKRRLLGFEPRMRCGMSHRERFEEFFKFGEGAGPEPAPRFTHRQQYARVFCEQDEEEATKRSIAQREKEEEVMEMLKKRADEIQEVRGKDTPEAKAKLKQLMDGEERCKTLVAKLGWNKVDEYDKVENEVPEYWKALPLAIYLPYSDRSNYLCKLINTFNVDYNNLFDEDDEENTLLTQLQWESTAFIASQTVFGDLTPYKRVGMKKAMYKLMAERQSKREKCLAQQPFSVEEYSSLCVLLPEEQQFWSEMLDWLSAVYKIILPVSTVPAFREIIDKGFKKALDIPESRELFFSRFAKAFEHSADPL